MSCGDVHGDASDFGNYNSGVIATTVNIETLIQSNTSEWHNEVNPEKRYASAVDLLRAKCSLTALVDSNDRFDPPRCAEETRLDIIQKLEDWVRRPSLHDHASSLFWLYGGAGAGKSALAQTLAEKLKATDDLAASFFFFRTDSDRNDGNRLISTLTYQLARSFQGLAPFVHKNISQNPDLFTTSRQTQILELLVEPLIRLSLEEAEGTQPDPGLKSHPRLVVIDGLDECRDSGIQCDLLRIIAGAIPHFPYPLRFLITTRPEAHITRTFQYDLEKVAQYNLSEDSDADKDILQFLEGEFAKIRRIHPFLPAQWPPRDDIDSLVGRSSSHFIYATTVIRYIQSPEHRPDDRLQIILGLKHRYQSDRPYARLDSLYDLIFCEVQHDKREKVHCVLGILHLHTLKCGLLASSPWNSDYDAIEALLEPRPGDMVLTFSRLRSLIAVETDNRIRIFHKSLFDYLLDSTRSQKLQLDLSFAHEAIANHILKKNNFKDKLEEFRDFAYHCQFARLNDALKDCLRTLASKPNIAFTKSVSRFQIPFKQQSHIWPSILYFLQVIGRQDLDSSGHCYRDFIINTTRLLKSAGLNQSKWKTSTGSDVIQKAAHVERILRSSLDASSKSFDLGKVQLLEENHINGRTPIPVFDTNIVESIEQEHKLISSYVKAQYRHPNIVFSFSESNLKVIHSCHFAIRAATGVRVTFVILVTYTRLGVRLSCSEFVGSKLPLDDYTEETIRNMVEKHFQSTIEEVYNNCTEVYSARVVQL